VTTKPSASRRNGPYALLGILCAAALVGALAGPTRPLAATPFTTTGHWVYNSVLAAVFHVDGGTANVDAQLPLHAEEGSRVLQGDTHGYVVGPGRITPFDKATLTPLGSRTAPSGEVPLGIEAVGGPYAVYRNAGKVVRLGDPAAVVAAGGAIGSPVVTADGTMWLHRTGVGSICTLARDGVELSGCPVSAPADHAGALTVLAGRPAFVDLFTSRLHTVDGGAFGEGRPLGASLSPNARPAAADLAGRVAILDPDRSSLLLVDPDARPVVPVRVALPPGDYDGPVSTGEAVVLVDRQRGAVLTYGPDGALRDEKPVKRGDGEPRLAKGEDERVYVEDSEGTQVLVVARHGAVQDVDVAGKRDPAPRTEVPDPRPDQQVALPGQPPAGRPDPVPGRTAPAVPAPTTPAPAPTTALPGAPTPTTPAPRPPEPTTPPPATPPPAPVPPGRPGAPPSVAARPGDGSALVTWDAAPDNRSPVTSYLVSWRHGDRTKSTTVGGDARQAGVEGLANGESYVFTVTATNAVGTGPGTSSNPVTPSAPVRPAGAPVGLKADYDVHDRPSRDVGISWGQPALNGGALVHYVVTGTGQETQEVTGTRVVYPQLLAEKTYTFTVHAVTRTPDGRLLDGEKSSIVVEDEPPAATATPSAVIRQGGPAETDHCHRPACAWVEATMSGLSPGASYRIRLSSGSNADVRTERFTADAAGNAAHGELNYDVPGETVWVAVLGHDGRTVARSDPITWK